MLTFPILLVLLLIRSEYRMMVILGFFAYGSPWEAISTIESGRANNGHVECG